MKRILLLILITTGCKYLEGQGPFGIPIAGDGYDGPAPRVAGQDEAEMIVWKWTFGGAATIVGPPPVVWIYNSVCTGDDNKVYNGSFACNGGSGCCYGYYNWQSDVIYVSWRGEHISDTSYAHEMCHAWWSYSDRGLDDDHEGNCYRAASSVYQGPDTLVGEANRRLKVVGQ